MGREKGVQMGVERGRRAAVSCQPPTRMPAAAHMPCSKALFADHAVCTHVCLSSAFPLLSVCLQCAWAPLAPPSATAASRPPVPPQVLATAVLACVTQATQATLRCPASWTPSHLVGPRGHSLPAAPAQKEVGGACRAWPCAARMMASYYVVTWMPGRSTCGMP